MKPNCLTGLFSAIFLLTLSQHVFAQGVVEALIDFRGVNAFLPSLRVGQPGSDQYSNVFNGLWDLSIQNNDSTSAAGPDLQIPGVNQERLLNLMTGDRNPLRIANSALLPPQSVPEPSVMALAAVGAVGLGFSKLRGKR